MKHSSVVIVGGGPAGSTLGSLLKKYDPSIDVLILEREQFPRDHVGESQLPPVSRILDEMGCWQKVEAAGFPIKVGATYVWGRTAELWDFDFYPPELLGDLPRPGTYSGPRKNVAFQVDRAIYDKILLDHARELGCEVHEETRVLRAQVENDRILGLEVEGMGTVTADTYIDASGHTGLLRRSLGIACEYPSSLQNVAIWDYWQNADWAERIGVGGTRVQVMSVGYGWIWFIPLGPTRTSIGLVLPAAYLKESGKALPKLYQEALAEQPRIRSLMTRAESEGKLQTTKDWSFVSERQAGPNWYLVGESSGFADPVLAAGLTITQAAAREAAFCILEERRGGDPNWLRTIYQDRQVGRIRSHIRFADYWYTANSQFTELQEYTAQIAKDQGLELSPERAWAWLAQGGFINDDLAAGLAGFAFPLIHQLNDFLADTGREFLVEQNNVFEIARDGARLERRATFVEGRVLPLDCWVRENRVWPLAGRFELWHNLLSNFSTLRELSPHLREYLSRSFPPEAQSGELYQVFVTLEALIADGWVVASLDPDHRVLSKMTALPVVHAHAN